MWSLSSCCHWQLALLWQHSTPCSSLQWWPFLLPSALNTQTESRVNAPLALHYYFQTVLLLPINLNTESHVIRLDKIPNFSFSCSGLQIFDSWFTAKHSSTQFQYTHEWFSNVLNSVPWYPLFPWSTNSWDHVLKHIITIHGNPTQVTISSTSCSKHWIIFFQLIPSST